MVGLRTILLASALLAGLVAADQLHPSITLSLSSGLLGVALMLAAWWKHRSPRSPATEPGDVAPLVKTATVALVLTGVAAIGFCDLGLRWAQIDRAYLPRLSGRTVRITGRLLADPAPMAHSTRLTVVTKAAGAAKVQEKVSLSVFGRPPFLQLGDLVDFEGKLKKIDPRVSFQAGLQRKGVVVLASTAAGRIRRVGRQTNVALGAANYVRSGIIRAARSSLKPDKAAFLLGLVLGDQSRIPKQTVEDFRASGLSHLVAVSGENLAMVLGPLLLLMSALRLRRSVQVGLAIFVVVMFTLMTRWQPSVLRAAIMAGIALASFWFGRKSHPLHALGATLIILAALNPMIVWSIGFQLSFAATAGILVLSPEVLKRLPASGGRLRTKVMQALALGLSAQVSVLPLVAWHFDKVSLVALPANLMALGLVAPPTIAGLAGGVVGLFSVNAARPFMVLSGLFVAALQWVARLFGRSAHAEVALSSLNTGLIVSVALLGAALVLWRTGRARLARWPAVLALFSFVSANLLTAAGSAQPAGMRLRFFDVGQGDAALVESPSGARVVIDGGPDPHLLANRLLQAGLSRIDLVIASHGHFDHINGLGEVLQRVHVRSAVDPGVTAPVRNRVFSLAPPGQTVGAAGENQKIVIGDLDVEFLGPTPEEISLAAAHSVTPAAGQETPGLNDASVAARVSYGGQCALFTGDVEETGQQVLLETHSQQIRCAILKAPHHGSAKISAAFVKGVNPSWVVVSVGPNDFGHPTRKALSIFQAAGAQILRTDQMGDVVLEVNKQGRIGRG